MTQQEFQVQPIENQLDHPDVYKLSRQLEKKDTEILHIQRNLAKWKDNMADDMAAKFDDELDRRIRM